MFFALFLFAESAQYRPRRQYTPYYPQSNSVWDCIRITGDINKALDQVAGWIGSAINRAKMNQQNLPGGGYFLSGVDNGQVWSAVYHPTRPHSASVKPGHWANVYPQPKVYVPGGEWAVTKAAKAVTGGNQAFYDIK